METKEDKLVKVQSFNIKPSLVQTKKLVNELNKFVTDNRLAVNIAGKQYLQIEAWQFIGSQLSLTAIVTDIKDVSLNAGEVIWQATVEVYHNPTGQLVSRGFALCSKAETKKKGFDAYAVASMAQTRAIGKAYRNILAWLPKLAGYEGTPADEMSEDLKENLAEDLSKIKADVFARFKALGVEDTGIMLEVIQRATGKQTIDNSDDAMFVLAELAKED